MVNKNIFYYKEDNRFTILRLFRLSLTLLENISEERDETNQFNMKLFIYINELTENDTFTFYFVNTFRLTLVASQNEESRKLLAIPTLKATIT